MCISITVVTIIITTPLTVETLFSVTTRSRQIEKRLFLGMTFGTSSIYVNNRIYIYRGNTFISFIAFAAHRFVASIFWRVYVLTRPNI